MPWHSEEVHKRTLREEKGVRAKRLERTTRILNYMKTYPELKFPKMNQGQDRRAKPVKKEDLDQVYGEEFKSGLNDD
jgi:hypothetical protein